MTGKPFDDLLRDVPDRVRLFPEAAQVEARRRRHRRRGLVAGSSAAAVLAVTAGLANMPGADRVEPGPASVASFLRAESDGGVWKVTRSDGTTLTIDPKVDFPGATLGLSPNGRWLSYAQGPESGAILSLYLQRSDQAEPEPAPQAEGATYGFAHRWSPDSRLVLVPVADGDVNVIDTDGKRVSYASGPGATTGFVDNDSLGWIFARRTRGEEGLSWEITNLQGTPERSVPFQIDQRILTRPGWPQLMVEQASLSPDGMRVAVLLATHRDQARLLVFSTTDGELIEQQDSTAAELQLECPFRWESGSPQLPRSGESCALFPE